RLHGGDFIVGGQAADGVQDRDQHRHRDGHRDDERHREEEHLEDDAPGQSLAHQRPELLRDLVEEEERRQGAECEAQRCEVLAEDVATEDAHGESGHYIRKSKSLQGMRLTASAVTLLVITLVPSARAQEPASDTGAAFAFPIPPAFALLPAPTSSAVRAGGRYGPASTPRAVA